LTRLGYTQVEGNRFERTVATDNGDLDLSIDLLAPADTPQMRSNVTVGDLTVDEIPGLRLALAMPATWVQARVRLTSRPLPTLSGQSPAPGAEPGPASEPGLLHVRLPLPDVQAALCLQAFAYRDRLTSRDALDIWRLLEAAHAAGVRAEGWTPRGARLDAARVLHSLYARAGKAGPEAASSDRRTQARIRALLLEVVARPDGI
jgi:hypothetical protein